MKNGLIIYFDGPDGVGKTSQLALAGETLRDQGYDVFETRTMGGTPIGEQLREVLLSSNERPVETDMHIALASQHALLEEVIRRRENGEIVLIDRSPLSIIGYQMHGDGLDQVLAYEATGELMDLFQPDLTLIYWAEPEAIAKRRNNRDHSERHNYFEDKPEDFHQRVADGFKDAAKHFGGKVVQSDGSKEEVHTETMKHIQALLA